MVQPASLFNQLLHHFPRLEFASLVKKHSAERDAKGFTCWTQFVSMLFCQLAHADSLREICNGLRCCLGKLVHLGIRQPPNKSTLAYANQHRPAALFEDLFGTALGRFRHEKQLGARPTKFRFKNKLLSLDSTTISLCLSLFPSGSLPSRQGRGQGPRAARSRRLLAGLCADHRSSTPRRQNGRFLHPQSRFHRGSRPRLQ